MKKIVSGNNNPNLLSVCCILVITIIVFLPAINNDFVNLDDNLLVTENKIITSLSLTNIKNLFTSFQVSLYHPLVFLSYAIEYKFFGLNPQVYHITNIILHLINTLLIYWLIYLLCDKYSVSFIVSILFAIHPLHVEPVAWVSSRKDVLYACFFLLSCISYIYYTKNNRKSEYYFLSLLLFILSVLSKPMAISLPIVLLLFDYYYNKKSNKNILPFFLIAILFSIIAIIGQKSISNIKSGQSYTLFDNILNASYNLLFYIQKMVVPIKLSCMYPSPDELGEERTTIFLISLIVLIFITSIIFLFGKNNRKLIFGLLFYIITILPVIHLIPVGQAIPADRYTYIPLTGLFYLSGEFIYFLYYYKYRRLKIINWFLIFIFITVISVFSFISYNRTKIWRNSLILWNNVIRNYPNVAIAYNDRGVLYNQSGDYMNAIADYAKAIEINPKYPDAYNNRGLSYANIGKYEDAITDYTTAIQINNKYAHAYNNRGIAYFNLKDYDNALTDFNKAIQLKSDYAEAYYNRGLVYDIKGEYEKAIIDYSTAIKYNPLYTDAYNNRGLIYVNMREYDKGIEDYTHAIDINPKFAGAYINRAVAYYLKNEYNKSWDDVHRLQNLGVKVNPELIKLLEKKK